ncbi:hypothetical protein ABFS83_10G008400 [Erythranthe nasuta]
MGNRIQLRLPFHLLLHLFLLVDFCHVTAKQWDGIIVTESDYQSLKALKHEFVDPKGVLSSWNDTGPAGACSGWAGIKCVNGQVISVQLPWKGLGGRISEKIGQLQSLRRLSLHDNAIVGPVPTSLGFLPNLRGVYLFNNRLSGSIPPSIGNCLLLQTLDLSNNQLVGLIPLSIANSTRLYRLNLSFNGVSGSIPISLSQSPSLTFLALQHNNLSGSVPDDWGSVLGNYSSYNLQSLALDHNLLSGNIPSSLSKLTMLEELNLSRNQIIGSIPDNIGNITSIVSLDLSGNNLTGEIPTSFTNLSNLTSFDVSYNNLSGAVPSFLAEKFNSSSFLGNTQLCGYSNSTPCPENLPSPSPSPSSQVLVQHRRKRRLSTKDIILIAAGALLVVLLILCCVLLCCLIRKKAASRNGKNGGVAKKSVPAVGAEVESGGETGGKLVHFEGPFVFTADDLLCATAEIMGKSTYGTAYKATLEDNNEVAVKRLREKITKTKKEFEVEIAQLGKIRHMNILAMRAYYLGPKGEKLLVYDYMPHGSLASFLHARGPETVITWPTRMEIAIGIARGLCYLHSQENNIVHGSLTSSNVLLDEQRNPKIADVGLSRLMTSAANTNEVATAGTTGYRAPEFTSKGKNVGTTKTDVFSLGVIMLELLTGKSPSEAIDGLELPQWVASIVKEEWTNEVFDVELMRGKTDIGDELLSTLKLALHCVDPNPSARPEAEQVLQKLEEIKPPQVVNITTEPPSVDDE